DGRYERDKEGTTAPTRPAENSCDKSGAGRWKQPSTRRTTTSRRRALLRRVLACLRGAVWKLPNRMFRSAALADPPLSSFRPNAPFSEVTNRSVVKWRGRALGRRSQFEIFCLGMNRDQFVLVVKKRARDVVRQILRHILMGHQNVRDGY